MQYWTPPSEWAGIIQWSLRGNTATKTFLWRCRNVLWDEKWRGGHRRDGWFLGRSERWVPDGLMFYHRCFFLFFRHAFSEVPRPIALKLCHVVGIWPNLIIPLHSKNSGVAPPQKKMGAQNMQNFGQFWTTSDFDREYLRNGWRYPKSAGVTNYGNSSCV